MKEIFNRRVLYIPIFVSFIYLNFTMFLYEFGPWDWHTQNKFATYSYLYLYLVSLLLGFIWGVKKNFKTKEIIIEKRDLKIPYKLIVIFSILMIIFNTITIIRNLGLVGFSFSEILEQVSLGISDPGDQYYKKLTVDKSNAIGGSIFTFTTVILSPFTWAVLPLAFYFWKSMNKISKMIFIMAIVSECLKWISIATNKGIFDILIILSSILLLLSANHNKKDKIKNKLKLNGVKLIFVLIFYFVISFFAKNISDRISGNFKALQYNTEINFGSLLFYTLPDSMHPLLLALSSYLTQGYYAFSISTNLNFPNTLGFGNSVFIQENMKSIIGSTFLDGTYQMQLLNYGWDPNVNWHTFYLWIGNDVSLIGVPIVMFIIGFLFAINWTECIIKKDLISIISLPFWFILIFYIPANNQIGQSPYFFVPFFFWISLFIIKKYFVFKKVKI